MKLNVWVTTHLLGILMAGTCPALHGADPLAGKVRIGAGHIDLRVIYTSDATPPVTLALGDDDSPTLLPAASAYLVVPLAARLELPEGFEIFGAAGTPLWVLQQGQAEEQPFLGLSGEGLPSGIFQPELQVRLTRSEGPGHVFAWQAPEAGVLNVAFNSRDGIGPDDQKTVIAGSHEHMNWGFTAPGIYTLTLQAELTLLDGVRVTSDLTPIVFAVEPLPPQSPFVAWQSQNFPGTVDPAVIGPDADPDADGYSNLAEFFFGTKPQTPERQVISGVEFTKTGDVIPYFLSPRDASDAVVVTIVPRDTLAKGVLPPLPGLKSEPVAPPVGQQGSWVRWSAQDTGAAVRPQRFYELRLQLR